MMQPSELKPGMVLHIDEAASVQFAAGNGFTFRLIRVMDRVSYTGWCWLAGYQLNAAGDAVERREIFVQWAGLRPASVRRRR